MLTMVFLITLLQLLLLVQFSICCELMVNTTYGLLRGTEFKSRNGRIVAAFHGVPFAKPPVGQHRFQVNNFMYKSKVSGFCFNGSG